MMKIVLLWFNKRKTANNSKPDEKDYDENDKLAKLRESLDNQNHLIDWKNGLIDSTFYNYTNLIISFGFVTLFAIAFPLTPLVYWIVTLVDVYTTKSTLLNISKRPNPVGAEDIGQWYNCLMFISITSIFTNVGVFIYTSNNLYIMSRFNKIIILFCLSFFFLFIFIMIDCTLSEDDNSIKVEELIKRQTYIVDKMNRFVTHRDEDIHDLEKIMDNNKYKASLAVKM